MLPEDLKSYRPSEAFQLVRQDVAGKALAVLLLLAFVADRLHWLA